MTFRDVCVLVLLIAGVGVEVVCCIGLAAMRDPLDRLHCAGAIGFGAGLVAAAIVVQESFSLIGNKALAVAAVLLFANPVLTHVTARTIRMRVLGQWEPHEDDDVEVLER